MRHWIAVLLALQFFSCLGIGALQPLLQERSATAAVASVETAAPGHSLATDSSVLDLQHDLLDELPDLPDGIDPWPLADAARTAWALAPPHADPHSASPSLEGLQRPPQS